MNELTITILRLGYLVLLWVFVLAIVTVLRRDLYGTRITARRQRGHPATGDHEQHSNPAPTEPSDRLQLVVVAGPLSGTTVPLTGSSVMIGRAPGSTLVIDDDYVSSRHARIFLEDEQWFVEDLGSTNGTAVGGERISQPVALTFGRPVRIGRSVIELRR